MILELASRSNHSDAPPMQISFFKASNRRIAVAMICLGVVCGATAGDPPAVLQPCFQPPADLAGKMGAFRSPLVFDDGTRLTRAADWPRRRAEILTYWHDAMGAWPPLLEKPAMKILREERSENFTRRRVSLEVAQGQEQEGWLLVPGGAGPFPAVLEVYYPKSGNEVLAFEQ